MGLSTKVVNSHLLTDSDNADEANESILPAPEHDVNDKSMVISEGQSEFSFINVISGLRLERNVFCESEENASSR